jgi:hypothetical protein
VDREGEGEFHRTDFLRASALGRYVKAFVCRKMPLQFTTRTGTPRLETSYKAISEGKQFSLRLLVSLARNRQGANRTSRQQLSGFRSDHRQ